MPITAENKKRYPGNWGEIREQVLEREGHKCKWCGAPNYAVGHRDSNGQFVPVLGNVIRDAAGLGQLPYAEAKEIADEDNLWDGPRVIVIVLTTAHIHDDSPENCDLDNLAALCQRCHNRHDAPARAERRKQKKLKSKPTLF